MKGLLAVRKTLLTIDILVKPKKKAKLPKETAKVDALIFAF